MITRGLCLRLLCLWGWLLWASPNLQAQCMGNLVWSDEFNGTSLDNTKWSYDIGDGCPTLCGWGNSELEYYTNRTNNVRVTGGNLIIEAIAENYGGRSFTSGKIHSRNKAFWTYGRFEARMRLPRGNGLWPAFWMLPEVNNWPTTGEIDIMEARGDQPTVVSGTLHYGNPWPQNLHDGNDYTLPTGDFYSQFHVFAAEWTPNEIRFYVDNILYKIESNAPNSLNPASNNANTWPWTTNFHFILNVAIGGWFTGVTTPAGVSILKSTMEVDYVRVYEMTSVAGWQSPWGGVARAVPGRIEAEQFDLGCGEAAYSDTDLGNMGGQMRGEKVDIEATGDVGGGYNVGWINPGEWLEYTLNVSTTATYDLQIRAASPNATGSMRIEIDGTDITGAVNIPNSGSWTTWQNINVTNRTITAGSHIMRIYFLNGGFNLNYVHTTINTVLPLHLMAFTGKMSERGTELHWQTQSEEAGERFVVERSTDGIGWVVQASMESEGVDQNAYHWSDPNLKTGQYYFRLRVEKSESSSFVSDLLLLSRMPEDGFLLYPNPSRDQASIRFQGALPLGLRITDMLGQVQEIPVDSDITFGSELPAGVYLLTITWSERTTSQLWIKE